MLSRNQRGFYLLKKFKLF